jgi:F-type H+-transporting ATPase subunit alpha
MVGRVVNTLGFSYRGPIGGDLYEMPLERKAPELSSVSQLLSHYKQGKAVDAMIPVVEDNVS